MEELTNAIEKPIFELRVWHDHLYKMEELHSTFTTRHPPSGNVDPFLQFTKLLPPVIYGETSDQKLLFVRVYVKLRIAKTPEDLALLHRAAQKANDTLSLPNPGFGQHGWLDAWQKGDPIVMRKWADVFEEAAQV